MRIWVVLGIMLFASLGWADTPASPRLAELTKKLAAKERGVEDAFWKQVTAEGTPLVEDVKDPKGRLLVTFVYRATPDVKHVAAYGTPSGFAAGYVQLTRIANSNTFAASMLVDPAARLGYWFGVGDDLGPPTGTGEEDLVRRQPFWRQDVLNKTPIGVFSSLVTLPKAPPQPWLVPKRGTPTGELTVHKVKSKGLGNERAIVVYTPPGFAKRGATYPLVVMFDGPAGVNNLGLSIMLDELIAAKQIPPVVVLMIGNTNRMKELALNEAFADFVALDLVPWVRSTYHATSDPTRTVIAGISLGGLAASFAASRHPAVYGNVLSQSGSYFWSAEDTEPNVLARTYAKLPRLPVRFWLEAGTYETGGVNLLGSNRHLRDVLVARGYDVTYGEFAGEHLYASWRGTFSNGLAALLATPTKRTGNAPKSPGTPAGIDVDAGRKTIVSLIVRTALLDGGVAAVATLKKLDAALVSEDEINMGTYALIELQHAREAIPLFEWNVERFPKSSNAHDSLAEACFHAGDRARALTEYKRSLELDPKNDNAKKMIELLR
jgi:enterochelin esterase family protein